MTKADVINQMAKEASISKAAAEKALNAFISGVKHSLAAGKEVTLVGFGTFLVAKRAARKGRNPQTGKPINIPAKKTPKFRAGKALREAVK